MTGEIKLGDYVVRVPLNTVIGPYGEVRLEPKAMEVLALLVERAGEVLSREEILEHVWQGRFVSDEVLTNVVSQIRRSLGDTPKDPRFIQTIAKKGYRLIAPVSMVDLDVRGVSHPDRVGRRMTRRWRAGMFVAVAIGSVLAISSFYSETVPVVPRSESGLVLVEEFGSLSGDSELDWLRTGIAELMVAGLSRNSRLQIVGPSRNRAYPAPGPRTPELCISGSFVRIGERLRIDTFVRDPRTGETLVAEGAEADSVEQLFDVVDRLTDRMAVRLELVHDGEPHLNRALRDVVTGNIEAYQHYVEGMRRYYYDLDHLGAQENYEKAVELDPGFSMAHAKLAIVSMNLGDFKRANASARQALVRLERLPKADRHYVLGNYYVTQEETYSQALEAYRRAVAADPFHLAARHNIGFVYFRLERYREAIEALAPIVESGARFPGSYRLLMMSYASLGEFREGQRVADAFVERQPEKWVGYRNLGQHLMHAGRLVDARRALSQADALRPGSLRASDWWQLNLLTGDGEPEPGGDTLAAPHLGPSMQHLFDGKLLEALSELERLQKSGDNDNHWVPVLLNLTAETHLQTGQPDRALTAALRSRELGRGNAAEWHALSLAAQAKAILGEWDAAERLMRELERRTESVPTEKENRRLAYLRGEIALRRGHTDEALRWLVAAEKLLPPRGFPITVQIPQHTPIRYALAETFRARGESTKARHWYEDVANSTTERLVWPILYVRSFYHLGVLYQAEGNHEKAAWYYRQFLGYWENGELDRQRVAAAQAALTANASFDPGRTMADAIAPNPRGNR